MIEIRKAIKEMVIVYDTLVVTLKSGMNIYIDLFLDDNYTNFIQQMWSRLYSITCPNDYNVMKNIINCCYEIIRSNLIGLYTDDYEYMIVGVIPHYNEISNDIQYVVLVQNNEFDTWSTFISSLSLDAINDNIKAGKLMW